MRLLYSLTLCLSALLLFLIQPMFTKMILPLLGGSPAVWNTAVVFYQAVLLLGYLYAHLSTRRLGVRAQLATHGLLLLLPLLALPIMVPAGWSPPTVSNPIPWLLGLLIMAVGLPFFVVSTSSPLLQAWFSKTGDSSAHDPYFLYAASNIGSLGALMVYPLLIEPSIDLTQQSWYWALGYGLFVIATLCCAAGYWRALKRQAGATAVDAPAAATGAGGAPTTRQRLRWILLALVPSSLMLSVTMYLTTNIAPIPLLWVIPLAIYLLTFILVFARRPPIPQRLAARALPFALILLTLVLLAQATQPILGLISLHLAAFALITLVCHGELAQSRPGASHLTEFYLWMSLGGVLGGMFNALLAPLLFDSVLEYPLILILAAFLQPKLSRVRDTARGRKLDLLLPAALALGTAGLALLFNALGAQEGQLRIALLFGVPSFICFIFSTRPRRFGLGVAALFLTSLIAPSTQGEQIYAERSFFGIHRVLIDTARQDHILVHGSTIHGRQHLEPELRKEPLTYYYRSGPIGQLFTAFAQHAQHDRIAVIGLGSGSLACYSQPGEEWTFYEIDPVVEQIARDPRAFSFLADCDPDSRVVLGDARLALVDAPPGYDLIVLDAYSSDSIPVHLLTREALQLYLAKLAPGGILAFHISNQYLNLKPVLAALARDAGMAQLMQDDLSPLRSESELGKKGSQWALIARDRRDFGPLVQDPRWHVQEIPPDEPVWTDDFSSILSVFKW